MYLEWLRQYLMQNGQLSEDLRIILTEHFWHIRLHKENGLLHSGVGAKKLNHLHSFMALLLEQKDIMVMLKLGWRIVSRQVLYVVRAMRRSSILASVNRK
jgi:hypothetical protein